VGNNKIEDDQKDRNEREKRERKKKEKTKDEGGKTKIEDIKTGGRTIKNKKREGKR
jgi:hypothetical protein